MGSGLEKISRGVEKDLLIDDGLDHLYGELVYGRVGLSDSLKQVCFKRSAKIFLGELTMATTAIETVIKMMETLPEPTQDQVVDHLREYIEELRDEVRWEMAYNRTQNSLIKAARQAKQEIAEGSAEPMAFDRL